MSDDLTDEQAFEAVEAEFRPGGQPLRLYMDLNFANRAQLAGQVLTVRIIANIEERLVAVERQLGLAE